jgi:hypothetical protein
MQSLRDKDNLNQVEIMSKRPTLLRLHFTAKTRALYLVLLAPRF